MDNTFTMLIIDHLAKVGPESNLRLKELMDRLSWYFVILRNRFNCTIVALQQFSVDLQNAKREKALSAQPSRQALMIAPQRLDFGDSKTTYRDADVVIGMVKPTGFDIDTYLGYDLSPPDQGGLGGFFAAMYLMKNRQGQGDKMFPLFINPVAGNCYDLTIVGQEKWLSKAKQLDKLWQRFSPRSA